MQLARLHEHHLEQTFTLFCVSYMCTQHHLRRLLTCVSVETEGVSINKTADELGFI
jgi:hypothetical protein